MRIRRAAATDTAGIRAVHMAAFEGEGRKVAELVDALVETIDLNERLSLVAVDDTGVVGHVMFTKSLLDAPSQLVDVMVLSPLGVLPSHQRRGIGAELVREGVKLVERLDAPLVFLEGDPAYYSRLGFRAGGELGFRRPSLRIPEPAFQVMTLPSHESWMTGTLVYAHAFWDADAVGLRAAGA
jgi:putative acetyltransferase